MNQLEDFSLPVGGSAHVRKCKRKQMKDPLIRQPGQAKVHDKRYVCRRLPLANACQCLSTYVIHQLTEGAGRVVIDADDPRRMDVFGSCETIAPH